MRPLIFVFLMLLAVAPVAAQQPFGISINVGVRKTVRLDKKSTIDLRQQIQLVPEIKKYSGKFGDFFNEDGFWPIPDRRQKDDDDDDEDDNDDDNGTGSDNGGNTPQNPVKELDDNPQSIAWDWRSTSGVQYNFQAFKWLRASAGYALMHDWEKPRHSLRAEIAYRPLRHFKGKRKWDVAARTLFQYNGAEHRKKREMRWQASLVPRTDVAWTFNKNHTLTWSNALNGVWDDGVFKFDRWRSNINLGLAYRKIHRFTLGAQYQKRLDKPRDSKGISIGYEVRF